MKVKYTGQTNPFTLTHGKEYTVESTECGWYRIVDESGEDYLYPTDLFEVTEELPRPPETEPESMPADMM